MLLLYVLNNQRVRARFIDVSIKNLKIRHITNVVLTINSVNYPSISIWFIPIY